MKTDKNILVAFILNITFSLIELIGGIFTNSIAILSDAIHDFGDALSIGIAFALEKKSKKKPDELYTFGYARYSVLGAFIVTTILTIGTVLIIIGAVKRILNPVLINYDGMIIIAILGVIINGLAARFTHTGHSMNEKAVNLHMLEDVFGWLVVLIGAVIMKFTNVYMLDSLLSITVGIFILTHAFKNFKEILDLFLVKLPNGISVEHVEKHLKELTGIEEIHHIHIWSMDGINNFATMHVRINEKAEYNIKYQVKEELMKLGIGHATIEIETKEEECSDTKCETKESKVVHNHKH